MHETSRRGFGTWVSAGIVVLAARSAVAAAPGPIAADAGFDITPYVHPELRAMVPAIRKMGSGSVSAATLPAMRKGGFAPPPLAEPHWEERRIPGPKGAPDVRVYLINGGGTGAPRPAIVHLHGGGFVGGTARDAIGGLQPLARELDCLIVTVDYRLAPETPFPGPLEDAYAALRWVADHVAALGVDPARIAVMGESAGGGLAAMLAIAARDRGEVPLAYQALVYPMLDDRTGSTRKTPPWQGAMIWTPGSNRFGWSSFLGVPAGSARVPHGAVPGRLADLRGLPPAFIGVGSIDLFVDEDIDYARRLLDCGIGVDLQVVPGGFHGFDMMPSASIGKRFHAALTDGLRQALAPKRPA